MPGTLTNYEQETIINFNKAEDIVTEANHQPDGFFCHACLIDKPASEASPDPRYCQWCYDFLLKETEMLPKNKRPRWIPKPQQTPQEHQNRDKKPYPIPQGVVLNMSTLDSEKSEVDIIQPPTPSRTIMRIPTKRGRKKLTLPVETILELSKQGLGSKAIATSLRKQGITVSYKTIQRVLSGERKISS